MGVGHEIGVDLRQGEKGPSSSAWRSVGSGTHVVSHATRASTWKTIQLAVEPIPGNIC